MDNHDELIQKQLEELFDSDAMWHMFEEYIRGEIMYGGCYQRIYMPGEIIPPRMGPFGEI